jgi:ABC-2 type transport system ATP-binding protein/lipopolysaccharide transport system ATP-binding protein
MASIILEKVSVSFPVYSSATRSIKNRLIQSATGGQIRSESGSNKISVVEALQDIDLTLQSGDRIGLVGHNGAGKTTLLRVLARIYEPNEGRVSVEGSTVPLFDISLGMDPESTGYENIILRGLYLGLSRRQVRACLDEIAEFTELGGFLDLPIRTYSAGMRMRLAFAVSTAVAPEILLIDEGIGAGDAAFLQKASERLRLFTEQVSIIVLSSHSEALVSRMCTKALLMEHGRVIGAGTTEEVLALYRERRDEALKAAKPDASRAPYPLRDEMAAPFGAIPAGPVGGDVNADWVEQTSQLLRAGCWEDVDLNRLLAEVESLGHEDSSAIEDKLTELLLRLLKWQYRPRERSERWRDLIDQARAQIEHAVHVNPGLSGEVQEHLKDAYRKARHAAARHTGLPFSAFPTQCPIPVSKVLDRAWLPGEVGSGV